MIEYMNTIETKRNISFVHPTVISQWVQDPRCQIDYVDVTSITSMNVTLCLFCYITKAKGMFKFQRLLFL